MTQKQIVKGNKLICKFITTKIKDEWYYFDHPILYGAEISHFNDFKFHKSWDYIIPVCKKWGCLTDDLQISDENYSYYLDLCELLDKKVTRFEILPVFEQLVNNIKWYNGLDTGK
jgi:hypothetical protein